MWSMWKKDNQPNERNREQRPWTDTSLKRASDPSVSVLFQVWVLLFLISDLLNEIFTRFKSKNLCHGSFTFIPSHFVFMFLLISRFCGFLLFLSLLFIFVKISKYIHIYLKVIYFHRHTHTRLERERDLVFGGSQSMSAMVRVKPVGQCKPETWSRFPCGDKPLDLSHLCWIPGSALWGT